MIIGVTGSIAAGKETLTGFFRERGFIYFETSALLKEELSKRGLTLTRENMQNLGDELRKKYETATGQPITAIPTTFVVNRKGEVASVHVGAVSKSVFEQEILKLFKQQG